jgi:hypothetical protein
MKKELKKVISSVFILVFAVLLNANPSIDNINTKMLYISYTKIPKTVYTKQRFEVKIKANILFSQNESLYTIHTSFNHNKSSVELLTQDIIWQKIDDNNYETALQFKVTKHSAILPQIDISIHDNENKIIDTSHLLNKKLTYRKIAINQEIYSNIIAKEFTVQSIKTKQYNNKELIHVLAIIAKESNLEEFYLNKYTNQGRKVLDSFDNRQMLYYFVITPNNIKKINFDYFDTTLNAFNNINININLNEELVSTQTDLNPYENDMFIYKIIAIAVVVMFFLIMYYFKKDFFFLFFAVIFMTLLIFLMWPNDSIIIKKNTKVYILPTSNSTVFHIVNETQKVKLLIKKEYFSKILFSNKRIGWIKNE